VTPQPTTTWSPTNAPTVTSAPTVKPGMKRRRVRATTTQGSRRSGNSRRTSRKLQTGLESRNSKETEKKETDKSTLVGIDSLISMRKSLNKDKDIPKNGNANEAFEIGALGNVAGFLFESEATEESPVDDNSKNSNGSKVTEHGTTSSSTSASLNSYLSKDPPEIDIPIHGGRNETREWSFPTSISAHPPNITHLDDPPKNERIHDERSEQDSHYDDPPYWESREVFVDKIPGMETEIILDPDKEDDDPTWVIADDGSKAAIGRRGLRSRSGA